MAVEANKTSLKRPKGDGPFPLIPKTEGSPDISHVLKEVFHDYIAEEVPAYETAKNMQRTCKDNMNLKRFADNVVKLYEDHQQALQDIANVEEIMIRDHARYLLKKDRITQNKALSDLMMHKPRPLFRPLDESILRKYPLIQATDIFPEGAKLDSLDEYLMSSQITLPDNILGKQHVLLPSKKLKELPKLILQDVYKTSVEEEKPLQVKKPENVTFVAKPNRVIFSSHIPGRTYEFGIRTGFSVWWDDPPGPTNAIAAGLSLPINVKFVCTSLDDVEDYFVVRVCEGKDVVIEIIAHRDPPILKALEIADTPEKHMSIKEQVLATSMECGITLVGDCVLKRVTLCNTGGKGSFWITTEEEWCCSEVKSGTWDNVLNVHPFHLAPFYFHLDSQEVIDLLVLYEPQTVGFQVEHLKVVCDNCTMRSLDLVGDAVKLDAKKITFKGLLKTFPITMDDDIAAEYYMNLGQVYPNSEIQGKFSVINESDLELKIKFDKRPAHIKPISQLALLPLSLSNINVVPKKGTLQPKSITEFTVNCCMSTSNTGMYRAVIMLYITGLPWQSIAKDSNARKIIANEKYANRVDVLINEFELWIECIPLETYIQPPIVKITGKLRSYETFFQQVQMHNPAFEDITFRWIEISPLLGSTTNASFTFEPLFGHVKARSFEPCMLSVTPLSAGVFQHELRCSVNDGRESVNMIICAKVSEPHIYLSTYIVNFGAVRRGDSVSAPLNVINGSEEPVIWVANESKYNFMEGKLEILRTSGLSADSGYLCHKGSLCELEYSLNTKTSGIWISVIDLCLNLNSYEDRQHFVLVVADIQQPHLSLLAPPRCDALLHPEGSLFVEIPMSTYVTIYNHSRIPVSFKWGDPVGNDVPKLHFKLMPLSDVVPPEGRKRIDIALTPLSLGNVTDYYIPCYFECACQPIVLGVKCEIKGPHVMFIIPNEIHEDYVSTHIPWNGSEKMIFFSKNGTSYSNHEPMCKGPTNKDLTVFENIYVNNEVTELEIPELQGKVEEEVWVTPEDAHYVKINCDKIIDVDKQDENEVEYLEDRQPNLTLNNKFQAKFIFESPSQTSLIEQFLDQVFMDDDVNEEEKDIVLSDGESPHFHTFPLANKRDEDFHCQDSLERWKAEEEEEEEEEEEKTELTNEETSVDQVDSEAVDKNESQNRNTEQKYSKGSDDNFAQDIVLEILSTMPERPYTDVAVKTTHVIRIAPEIHMKNVKAKEMEKTTFSIKNETPLRLAAFVNVNNFKPRGSYNFFDMIKAAESEVYNASRGKWNNLITPGTGIVVAVNPSFMDIGPYEELPVDICVFADTWGIYFETVVCYIEGLPLFYIRLVVEVKDMPIHLPVIPNEYQKQYLRFGVKKYMAQSCIRSIKVCNESCVQVGVSWHIFLKESMEIEKEEEEEEEQEKEWPFTLILDITSSLNKSSTRENDDVKCGNHEQKEILKDTLELKLIPKYGTEDYTYFQIYPREFVIEPWSYKMLNITFNPVIFDTEKLASVLAFLMGYIKIAQYDGYKEGRLYRPSGQELGPVWTILHGEVEMPLLSWEIDEEDLEFYMSAAEVMTSPSKFKQIRRIVVVKNNNMAPITALVELHKPFILEAIDTMEDRVVYIEANGKLRRAFTLLQGECAELHILCLINEIHITRIQQKICKTMGKELQEDEIENIVEKKVLIKCPLILSQPNLFTQCVKLNLNLNFPVLKLSSNRLDFGPVFAGDTKWMSVELENKTESKVWFQIVKLQGTREFIVRPTCGVLSEAPTSGHSRILITVYFSPREGIPYQDFFRLQTAVKGDEKFIMVQGVGTLDAKQRCYDCKSKT